jgi:molybdate transport system substrate-binding protein
MRRRDAVIFLAATATLPLTRPASAVTVPDLGIFCDPTLRPVVTKICDLWCEKTGVPARVLCAPGGLMIAQLVRNARNDVVITRTDSMAAAAAQGQIKPETRANLWRGPLVLAVRAGTSSADPKTLKGPIAATDPTAAAAFDGRAVLADLGISPDHIIGAANTGDVADLVKTGAAQAGLVYATDVAADPALAVGAALQTAPASFAAAQSRNVQSWRAADFLTFLATPEAAAAARAGGLEIAA